MKRKKLISLIIAFTLAALSCGVLAACETRPSGPRLAERIIHSGGDVGGHRTSNSKEAIDAAYAAGNRYIELDFMLSSDGEPVCIHDWSNHYLHGYIGNEFPLSLEEFEGSSIYGELTPLTLESLAEWLKINNDAYIITDIKYDNLGVLEMIAERHHEIMDRIIPQIYELAELEPVYAMGFENVILTVYNLDWEIKADAAALAEFAKENKLWGITFPYELAERDGYVEELLKSGTSLYAHTLNDEAEIERLLQAGITGVYTDIYQG